MPASIENLHAVATKLERAALAAVEPVAAVRRHVRREGDALVVADRRYDLSAYERVFVVAGGKAAVPMTSAIGNVLGDCLNAAIVVTKRGSRLDVEPQIDNLQILEAGHPVPDEDSVRGAQAIADLARQATERDLLICLISGGCSALLTLPIHGLILADLQALTDALLRSGATINEMNTVRKHCSQIKGGNLARLAAPAALVTLILSDVVGDPLDVIGSGPTVPDPTTTADAQAVLKRYGIEETEFLCKQSDKAPPSLRETPKPGDPMFERVQHIVVGSNRLAAVAAVEQARRLGFDTLLLSTYVEGEAREVARVAAALAKAVRAHGDPLPPPACLVWGGETTVTMRGEGKGGRNQELALAAALALDGWPGVLVMALATDGGDGPTDAAGAVVTGETVSRARALGLDPLAALAANDSYPLFDALGDLIRTGPTGTNVNDLLFVLVGDLCAPSTLFDERDCDIIPPVSNKFQTTSNIRRQIMQVTTEEFKRCDLVKAVGRVDSKTAPQLAKAFEAITEGDRFKIVFDMSQVDFVSSAGLRVMISVQKTCKRWNRGELVLAGVSAKINDVMDLAGFVPLFKFYETAIDAVGSF